MKIISGSFGAIGTASFDDNGWIALFGDKAAAYPPGDIEQSTAWQETEKEYSLLSVALGVIITFFLAVGFGILGFLGGLLLTIAGSRKNYKKHLVEIRFADGKTVTLLGSRKETKKFFETK